MVDIHGPPVAIVDTRYMGRVSIFSFNWLAVSAVKANDKAKTYMKCGRLMQNDTVLKMSKQQHTKTRV